MEIGDYNKQLSSARDDFRQKTNDLRKVHQQELADLDDLHESVEKKQAQTYYDQRENLQENIADLSQEYGRETAEAIEVRKRDYVNSLNNEKEEFNRQNLDTRKKLSDELTTVKDSYEKNYRTKEREYQKSLNRNETQKEEILAKRMQQSDQEFKEVENFANKSIQKVRDDVRERDRDLTKLYEGRISDVLNNSANQLSDYKNKKDDQINNLRQNYDIATKGLANRQSDVVKTIRKDHMNENQNTVSEFIDKGKEAQERSAKTMAQQNLEHADRMRESDDKFNREMGSMRKLNESLDNAKKVSLKAAEDRTDRVKDAYETRLNKFKGEMENARYQHQVERNQNSTEMQDAKRAWSENSAQKIASQKMDNFRDMDHVLKKSAKEKEEIDQKYKKNTNNIQADHERQLFADRAVFKRMIDNQKLDFTTTIKELNDRHEAALKDMQEGLLSEKTSFYKNMQMEMYNDRENLKDELKKVYGARIAGYEQKVEQLLKDNKKLEEQYQGKLDSLAEKTYKELEARSAMEGDRRVEDLRETKRALLDKVQENAQKEAAMKDAFDLEMARAKNVSEKQQAQIVNEYEDKLSFTENEYKKELEQLIRTSRHEYDRMSKSYEHMIESMKQQYEVKLEKMRLTMDQEKDLNSRRA
ncbi:MAG: hypothetical protein A2504_12605 [Bdellovibrionales bacterium RIFOXYD12_FULL_39_22]|nr:MAG: hypothetical protein A2385_00055 [Bdellovibrionales bacterium RIFOXYB1_FULL_39_21]OFZ44051.1 MAG: hypothetical protein A2485_03720 [Bdellovibrionales bacterium RIFOXYC12_FULL_39_17]OFZ48547.1 MAG: hypothetical protein A2404_07350 [Bdellovibrionales bacterium RIFOXYC1_FULL_39_130]OFZ73398.1 MAG: hypothetical protein A2451_01965 [Bdellovibrionales bacterium RIFOXYC2_FULL_39_8]OFZ76735.1 MAG: hypothetical protein A2560_11725 [Bdellovibrionales bacterium RIFOXYD1_FULL_39_84]OFZ95013.1 MAG: